MCHCMDLHMQPDMACVKWTNAAGKGRGTLAQQQIATHDGDTNKEIPYYMHSPNAIRFGMEKRPLVLSTAGFMIIPPIPSGD